jgi:hypothetical protein
MGIPADPRTWPRETLAERVSAAAYGTVLVLAALAVLNVSSVSSGLGWELVTGVGLATWIAHIYAEVVGDHIRHDAALDRGEIARSVADGLPIPLTAVAPAVTLGLGGLEVLTPSVALWGALLVALLQLVGLGAFVGWTMSDRVASVWSYAGVTAAIGLAVVTVKLLLLH